MTHSNSDAISSQTLASGKHYYSDGKYLREKHQLAGNQFIKWAFPLIPSWTSATILDAGGGWGRFVWPLVDVPDVAAHQIILTDLPTGMLKTAIEEADQRGVSIHLAVCNIEALPFPSRQFDVVMAN